MLRTRQYEGGESSNERKQYIAAGTGIKMHSNCAACGGKDHSARDRECPLDYDINRRQGSKKKDYGTNGIKSIRAQSTRETLTIMVREKSLKSGSSKTCKGKDSNPIYGPGSPRLTAGFHLAAKLCDLLEIDMQTSPYHNGFSHGYGELRYAAQPTIATSELATCDRKYQPCTFVFDLVHADAPVVH